MTEAVKVVVDDRRNRSLLAAGAGAGACVKFAPCLIPLLLLLTLAGSGGAGVALMRMLGLENQVDRLEAENDRLTAANDEYEALNSQFKSQLDQMEQENAAFQASNEEFARLLQESAVLTEQLENTTKALRAELKKLQNITDFIEEAAKENNALFEEILDQFSSTINSSRSQQDSLYRMLVESVLFRIPNVLTPLYSVYDFVQKNESIGTSYVDVFEQTMNILADVCVIEPDLDAWLKTPAALATFSAAAPTDLTLNEFISLVERYGFDMVEHYFQTSGIQWYTFAHDCANLPDEQLFSKISP